MLYEIGPWTHNLLLYMYNLRRTAIFFRSVIPSFFLRVWVNLLKNPEFLFDINKSALVNSSLSVVAQALMDACSSNRAPTSGKVRTIGSRCVSFAFPSSKLFLSRAYPPRSSCSCETSRGIRIGSMSSTRSWKQRKRCRRIRRCQRCTAPCRK